MNSPERYRCLALGVLGPSLVLACSVETAPLAAYDDYLPLTGGQLTGSLSVDGRLGVGTATTATPGLALSVSGSSSPEVGEFASDTPTARIYLNATNGGRRWGLESSGGNFQIGDSTANADRLVIDTNGNVGVGTTTPTAKLDVAGDLHVTGNVVGGNGTVSAWATWRANTLQGGYNVNSITYISTGRYTINLTGATNATYGISATLIDGNPGFIYASNYLPGSFDIETMSTSAAPQDRAFSIVVTH